MKHSHVFMVAIILASICANAQAQTRAISLAYQVTHVDQASPAISPDGKRMVYAVAIEGKEQLFIANLEGSESVQVTHGSSNHDNPIWSPDGRKLVYASDKTGAKRSTSWR